MAGRWWSRGYFQPQNSAQNSVIWLLFVWFEYLQRPFYHLKSPKMWLWNFSLKFQPKIQWLFLGLFLGRWAEVGSLSDGPETSGVCIVLVCSKDNWSYGSLSCLVWISSGHNYFQPRTSAHSVYINIVTHKALTSDLKSKSLAELAAEGSCRPKISWCLIKQRTYFIFTRFWSYRVSHIEVCKVNQLWGIEGSMVLLIYDA